MTAPCWSRSSSRCWSARFCWIRSRRSRAWRIKRRSWARWNGLVRKSYAPSFIALTASSTVPKAVRRITSTSDAIALTARSSSIPESPGILRSVRTRSTPPAWRRSRAALPSEARMTRYPSRVSVRSRLWRSPGSSSAISSVAGSDTHGPLDRQPDREDRAPARADELGQLAHEPAHRLLLEVGAREAREREVLLGEGVQRGDLLADGGEEAPGLLHLPRRSPGHDVAQHLGVEADGGDGVAHLVGHLEGEPPDRRHALGHDELLLRGLELRQGPLELLVEPLHLRAGPSLAVGHVAERECGEADQPHQDHDRGPRRLGRREPRRRPVEEAGDAGEEEAHPPPEVVGVDGHEREEEVDERAVAAAREIEEGKGEQEVDTERRTEDEGGGARLDGDEGEDPRLVEGEPLHE